MLRICRAGRAIDVPPRRAVADGLVRLLGNWPLDGRALRVTNPMPNHPYAIQRADGSVEHGVTNDAGFTHTVSSHLPESIKLFVE